MSKLSNYPKNSFIPADDNLISFAEQCAKNVLGTKMAYSPATRSIETKTDDKTRSIESKDTKEK